MDEVILGLTEEEAEWALCLHHDEFYAWFYGREEETS